MLYGTPRFITLWCRLSVIAIVSLAGANIAHAQTASATGGFTDSATSTGLRPMMSAGEMATFLPSRGTFTFPAPYGTTGIRLTNASDCGGGDCVIPVGYSYWNNVNNHAGSATMLIFVGTDRRKGGVGPSLMSYNKNSGETRNLGALFGSDSPYSWSTGEGWYFSRTRQNALYMNDGPRLMRYDVVGKTFEEVFNVGTALGGDKYLWQVHSSSDDRVHSATVRNNSSYEMLGCVAYREDTRQTLFYAKKGDFDECQIDKSGRWLVMKENVDGRNGEDNRIIDLNSGTETVLLDENGAAGHSDMGWGYMVTEDNFHPQPGAVRVMKFGQGGNYGGTLVYQLSPNQWATGLGHVAHSNASAAAPEQQMACSSNASRLNLPRVNEIVCFKLDGSLNTLIVAPNLEDLNAPGGGSDDYMKLPKGNVDPTGEYFVWTANAGTNRTDLFMVRIPVGNLGVALPGPTPLPSNPTPTPSPAPAPTNPSPAPAPAPAPAPTAPAAPVISGDAIRWTGVVNATVSGSTLAKSGGCGGCGDASAVSEQRISDNGGFEFTAADASPLRYVGLSAGATDASAIAFALRLQGGIAEVREAGAYKADVRFNTGDVFRILIGGGSVTYSKNGAVFYTSAQAPSSSMVVAASLYDMNALVTNAVLSGGAAAAAEPEPAAPAAGPEPEPEAEAEAQPEAEAEAQPEAEPAPETPVAAEL